MSQSPFDTNRERLFLQALQTMQVGVTLTDADGRILYVNPAEARMHGYTVEELVGRRASVFAPPGRRQPLSRDDLEGVRSWKRETVNVRKDGTTFPVELLSDVLTDADGNPVGLVSISQDISERKAREEALRRSEERFALAARGANDGIWDWDLVTDAVYYSPRWQEMLGLSDVAVDTPDAWLDRIHPEDREEVRRSLDHHLDGETAHFESEHRLLHRDGSYRWVLARGVAVRGEEGTPRRMAGSLSDVTDRRAHDPLTELPNRTLLMDRLNQALVRGRRGDGRVGLIFLDLDRFKVVNDSLGHMMGDRLLVEVARRLEDTVREGETVARLGGDEFVAVLEDVGGAADAEAVARRIHAALAAPVHLEGHEVFISASMGISVAGGGETTAQDLLREADTAMYRAKAAGRAQTQVFDESMRALAVEQLRLGNDLRRAVDEGEFELHYQPIVATGSRALLGVEALLRWAHPERGILLPMDFLALAEETGLIVPIGRWVLREACRQAAQWLPRLQGDGDFTVGVNVSPRELVRSDYVEHVLAALGDSGLEPGRLRLEVTEEVLIEDLSGVAGKLGELRRHGVKVAIDDFGTGYSSLSYLDRLPADVLKIDRAFVVDLESLRSRRELIRSIVRLATDLSIDVVVEGVENETQIPHLTDAECRALQGYALGRPARAADITARFVP